MTDWTPQTLPTWLAAPAGRPEHAYYCPYAGDTHVAVVCPPDALVLCHVCGRRMRWYAWSDLDRSVVRCTPCHDGYHGRPVPIPATATAAAADQPAAQQLAGQVDPLDLLDLMDLPDGAG